MTSDIRDPWRVQLLQSLRVQRGDKVVDRFETRRAASLLAYLAFYPHRIHAREEIAEMLWPEEDPEVTRVRLRQVLNTIRRLLDSPDSDKDGLLLTDRSSIRINTEVVITDVGEFERLRKAAAQMEDLQRRADKLRQAATLYGGELLPGYYEDWVQTERRRLAGEYREVLLHLKQAYTELGDRNAALEYARRAVALDALDEETCAALIQLYAQMGRPAEAIRQYQTLEQALWKELRVVPSVEIQALIATVRTAKASPVATPVAAAAMPPSVADSVAPPVINPPASSVSGGMRGITEAGLSREGESETSSLFHHALTAFFGRQQEIEELVALLRPDVDFSAAPDTSPQSEPRFLTRLVTLVGPGGLGKTRLAQEVVRALQPLYGQSLWFIPFTEINDSTRILERIAEALSPRDIGTKNGLESLLETFRHRPALLILDNFEQLVGTGVSLIRTLLERAPTLRCLVTSRQALQIAGEHRMEVAPLPLPDLKAEWELMRQSPSLRLFEDRARKVAGDFTITTENADAVAALCRHLEGLPLALELAAAWMAVLSPEQLLQRLDDRFKLLVTQQQDTPVRHRSLYATIEWSYTSLPAEIQRFFTDLSVFCGGWTLEAAESVSEDALALMHLAQLQRHSLIFREADRDHGRMRMLETLRDFAAPHVEESRKETLRRNHARYYVALAERAELPLIGPDQSQWLERLHAEQENLRAALQWSMEVEGQEVGDDGEQEDAAEARVGKESAKREKREIGLRFVASLWRFWDIYCHYEEAESWIESLLVRGGRQDSRLWARALLGAGALALSQGAHDTAQQRLEQSVRYFAESGDERGKASAFSALAATLRDKGDPAAAKPLFEQALAIMQSQNDPFGMAQALGGLGIIASLEQDMVCAHNLLEQSAAMYRICGHRKGLAWTLYERGLIALRQGDMETRLRLFQEGLLISQVLNDSRKILFACYNIGAVYQLREAWSEAEAIGQEARRVAQGSGLVPWEITYRLWLGDLACEQGRTAEGNRHYEEGLLRSAQVRFLRGVATALERLAGVAVLSHDLERAVCLFSAAQRYAQEEPVAMPNAPRHLTPALYQQLSEAEADPAFTASRTQGAQMSLEELLSFATSSPPTSRD